MKKILIRNFSIIAHIDHGKSTLADRLIQLTGAVDKRNFREQLLDDMDLERERGITIKASAVRLNYRAKDGEEYILNLIDTPGHVDFTYEVAKSLAACEGALLVVDASQGIEAQTAANFYMAKEHNLVIIPVINKIDLSNADVDRVKLQLIDILRFNEEDIILASAKDGIGIEEILERIVKDIPPPAGDETNPLQALVFDSTFDKFKGVIIYIRIKNGRITPYTSIKMMNSGKVYKVEEIGIFRPHPEKIDELLCGEVGYISCNIRDPHEVIIGDTVTYTDNPATEALPGYKQMKPLVFCGIYPVNAKDFINLREALEKLRLNDASFVFEPETSQSFGYGFRCGFLGLLHMEIVQERLEREYDLNLILTTPNVVYKVKKRNGEVIEVHNPAGLPQPQDIALIEEPFIFANILIPLESMEAVIDMVKQRRGIYKSSEYLSDRVRIVFEIPLSEAIVDFYDKIKSLTKGYGSLDYEFKGYVPSKISKLDILINGKPCDAFSSLVHKQKAYQKARAMVDKLKELIPRQLFEVVIQASADNKIIASEKIRPLGKHVTGKCYGGDITRKRKLWQIQKEGKKRMKQFGRVQIPQEAFLALLKI
jgi:GTP-binding protein LepA